MDIKDYKEFENCTEHDWKEYGPLGDYGYELFRGLRNRISNENEGDIDFIDHGIRIKAGNYWIYAVIEPDAPTICKIFIVSNINLRIMRFKELKYDPSRRFGTINGISEEIRYVKFFLNNLKY